MQVPLSIPAVWVYTTQPTYNGLRSQGYASFLTKDQQARLERIRQGRLLFDGKHRDYFLDEQRTQFDFPRVRAGDRIVQMYLTYNVLGLISLKSADLLFGAEPLLRVDDETQQQYLADLVERCNLHALLYGCAVDASYEAECCLEAVIDDGQVYLVQVPADEIYPVGDLGPDGQYESYCRYSVQNVGTQQQPIWLLLETTYAAGSIERHCYQLGDDGSKREVGLDQWPQADGAAPLAPTQATGVDRCTITWIPNLLIRRKPVGDYDGAIELQDALNAKNSQVGRVLLKHSDPKLLLPEEAFDEFGNVRQDYDVFAYTDPDKVPKYVTWNAELTAAMADRAFVLNQLLVRTETSPVLLGLKEGAAPDAYKKVRLESFNSLTKAQRKAAYWKAGVRRAVSVAQDLENTLPGVRYDRQPIGVELRDGIPPDDFEQAQTIGVLLPAHAMSRQRAVQLQLNDPASVQKELAAIADDLKSAAPTFLMGEPGPAPGSAPADNLGGAATQPPAANPEQPGEQGVAA